jgi:hypothetical protein
VYTVVNLRVAGSVGCFLNGWWTVGFSIRAPLHGVRLEKSRYLLCVLQAKCLVPACYTVPWNCVLCLVVSEVWKLPALIILFILCRSAVIYLIWFRSNINRTKTNTCEVQIFGCVLFLDMKCKWRDWTANNELGIRFRFSRRRMLRILSGGKTRCSFDR